MDSEAAIGDVAVDSGQTTAAAQKMKFLSNGTNEQGSPKVLPEGKSLGNVLENGLTCNGAVAGDDSHASGEGADVEGGVEDDSVARESCDTVMRDDDDDNEDVRDKFKKYKPEPSYGEAVRKKKHKFKSDEGSKEPGGGCDQAEESAGALLDVTDNKKHPSRHFEQSINSEVNTDDVPVDMSSKKSSGDGGTVNEHISSVEHDNSDVSEDRREHRAVKEEAGVKEKADVKLEEDSRNLGKESLREDKEDENIKDQEEVQAGNENKEKSTSNKHLRSASKGKRKNSQKNVEAVAGSEVVEPSSRTHRSMTAKPDRGLKDDGRNSQAPSSAGDIEIVGQSKVGRASGSKSSQNAHFGMPGSVAGMSGLNQGGGINSLATGQGLHLPTSMMHGFIPGFSAHGLPPLPSGFPLPAVGPGPHPGQPSVPVHVPTVAPPKPKSSLDQIELIRWEIQNRINTRPKYFKPNPSSDLGPLAKFLFDIGSDLIKEAVYHDLVKIQSKKNGDNKLNAKEKEDLQKLKEIEKDLFATIGHLKLKLRQKCRVCNFQTESSNVMFYHKQYPHEDNKCLRCAHCPFTTRQAVAFKLHMEAEHAVQAKLHDKKACYECDLCPYENNQQQKLVLHKQRCLKQFRPLFNLHPSCLSGAEINLCLENIFYKPVVPKNLKLLQQKHAQQQAALAEARRQQAQMQVLAAQKNAAAVAARKQQQQLQKSLPAAPTPRARAASSARMPAASSARMPGASGGRMPAASGGRMPGASGGRMPVPPRLATPTQPPPVRYNASNPKAPCPTVATMLNAKQNAVATPPPGAGVATSAPAAGGFEVCEICGGYVKDRKALRIHFFYAHRIDLPFNLFDRTHAPLYCATCYVRFWTAHGLRKHIDTHKEENQTRGVVGKCISCGHHVLNLLLHMRVVHNREMQHYITALMCMFCGNHFSSPQECEQHILKVHGHVDPLTGTLKSAPSGAAVPPPPPPKPAPSSKKPGNNNLVKGSVCVLCNLNFGRNVDLTRHCMRMHHTCMKCGMVVIDKASLMKHTCLSSPSGTRDCAMCGETGFHPAYYVKHLRDKHLQKFSIRVSKLGRDTIERWTKRPYPFKDTDVLVEISDDDGNGDDADGKASPKPAAATTWKRPRIGPASKIGRPKIKPELLKTPLQDDEKDVNASVAEDAVGPVIDEVPVEDEVPVKNEVPFKDELHVKDEIKIETPTADDSDDKSSEPSPGQKRKLLESPGSDTDAKRKK